MNNFCRSICIINISKSGFLSSHQKAVTAETAGAKITGRSHWGKNKKNPNRKTTHTKHKQANKQKKGQTTQTTMDMPFLHAKHDAQSGILTGFFKVSG